MRDMLQFLEEVGVTGSFKDAASIYGYKDAVG